MSIYAYVPTVDPQGPPINTNEPWGDFPVLANVIKAYEQQAAGDDSLFYSLLMQIGVYAVLMVVDDQSTTEQTIQEPSYIFGQEPNHVTHTYVTRDMTPEELDADQGERADFLEKSDIGRLHAADMRLVYALAVQIQPGLTEQQFINFVTNARNDNSVVTMPMWKTWARPILNAGM